MKTLRELYGEILAGDELKKAFEEAYAAGKIPEFLKEHGCGASDKEIGAFIEECFASDAEPLSDDELESAAGGSNCKYYVGCQGCGGRIAYKEENQRPPYCTKCGYRL